MATETSAQGGTNGVNVDGILRAAAPAAPTSGQSIRQIISLGDGGDNLQLLSVDAGGSAKIKLEGGLPAYSLVFTTTFQGAGDYVVLQGSASKIIRLRRLIVSGYTSSTTIGPISFLIQRRSAASTGGTSASPTIGQYDVSDPAPSVSLTAYSAPPTAGASVGNLLSAYYQVNQNVAAAPLRVTFGDAGERAIVIRGASDFVALRYNAMNSGATTTLTTTLVWTEE